MEAWASDQSLSGALRVEWMSYKWCKLYDTWAEASHRDVSREATRCTHASQAWISATLRMHQNLDMWETLDLSSRRRFEVMFRNWKSIGQVKPRYSLAMRRCKMQHKALLVFVYRSGRQALVN